MNVGIVTWHKGNIGSTLQAYALSTTIKKLGYETELINIKNSKYDFVIRKIRSALFHICFLKSGLTRDYTYKFIRKNVNESPELLYNELSKYSKKFDACVCGSDQIWNCVLGVNPAYFLQFVPDNKRISYAPSIGLMDLKDECKKEFCEYINSIPYLSVRELQGAKIIKNLTGLNPKVVLDPTLLLNKKEWSSLANGVSLKKFGLKKDEYILCYYLGNHNRYIDYTNKLSTATEKKIIYVSFKRKHFGKNQVVCSIEEFLMLVRDSYCVLTDSFHGTVIPMNLGKKVAVFERFVENDPLNQNSRIYNVLEKFELRDWIISPQEDINSFINRNDDMSYIQKELEKERVESIEYLKKSLYEACNT